MTGENWQRDRYVQLWWNDPRLDTEWNFKCWYDITECKLGRLAKVMIAMKYFMKSYCVVQTPYATKIEWCDRKYPTDVLYVKGQSAYLATNIAWKHTCCSLYNDTSIHAIACVDSDVKYCMYASRISLSIYWPKCSGLGVTLLVSSTLFIRYKNNGD